MVTRRFYASFGIGTYLRTHRSSQHLAHHFAEVPLLLFCFDQGQGGAATYPAAWSAMLAARAEGVGSTLTTILGLRAHEVLALLGVPPDAGWKMTCCVAMGYPTGRWGIAPRRPVHEVAARNRWDGPLGFTVPEPLWPRPSDPHEKRSENWGGAPSSPPSPAPTTLPG
jgi:nitroreductase